MAKTCKALHALAREKSTQIFQPFAVSYNCILVCSFLNTLSAYALSVLFKIRVYV